MATAEDHAFARTIAQRPNDPLPYLAYAEALKDRGEFDAALMCRAMADLAGGQFLLSYDGRVPRELPVARLWPTSLGVLVYGPEEIPNEAELRAWTFVNAAGRLLHTQTDAVALIGWQLAFRVRFSEKVDPLQNQLANADALRRTSESLRHLLADVDSGARGR